MVKFLIDFCNVVISALGSVASMIFGLLPNSPFQTSDNSAISDFMGSLNWIIPISSILSILSAWVVCIATYYLIQIVMRWVKAID